MDSDVRIDLHSHSVASDGTDTPAELVTLAAAAGLDVLAITDHDTTDGWAPAAAARPAGLTLIRGAEFSTQIAAGDRMVSVHLLGYLFDPADAAVVAEQTRLREERRRRGMAMVQRMAADGLPISGGQVMRIADGAPVGRPHIGQALIESGVVESVDEAFASLLGGPHGYYLPKADTDLATAVRLVTAAGGAAVLAHPRGRGEALALRPAVIGELAQAGLVGIEVDHPDHPAAARAELAAIAAAYGLLSTGSSDYHGHNKTLTIGQETTRPDQLVRLVERTSGVTPVLGELS